MNAVNDVPSSLLVDAFDVAVAADLWRRGAWSAQGYVAICRSTPTGVAIPETMAGNAHVDAFLSDWVYDAQLVAQLRSLPALRYIDGEFWDVLAGLGFTGALRDKLPDGTRFTGGPC